MIQQSQSLLKKALQYLKCIGLQCKYRRRWGCLFRKTFYETSNSAQKFGSFSRNEKYPPLEMDESYYDLF